MVSGNVGGQVWFALTSTPAVPHGTLAATASFGVALVAALAAFGRRARITRQRRE